MQLSYMLGVTEGLYLAPRKLIKWAFFHFSIVRSSLPKTAVETSGTLVSLLCAKFHISLASLESCRVVIIWGNGHLSTVFLSYARGNR